MPFNGSGSYNPPPPPTFPAVTNTTIKSSYFNSIITDIANALSDCVTRDGQSPPTANLPMGGFKLTGLGAGTLGSGSTDSVNGGQVFDALPVAATESVAGILRFATSTEVKALSSTSIGISPGELATLASTTAQVGISRFATALEAAALTSTTVGLTPAGLANVVASETTEGIVQFATSAQVLALTNTGLAVSPGELGTLNASTTQKGILKTAAGSDVITGTSTSLAVTPKALNDSGFLPLAARGWITFNGATSGVGAKEGVISGITKVSTGVYTINFGSAYGDTAYAVNVSVLASGVALLPSYSNKGFSSVQINIIDTGGTPQDSVDISVSIFHL